jgi:hypothetical protein
LISELQEAEQGQHRDEEVEEVMSRLEGHLESGDIGAASRDLQLLSRLSVARITLDGLRVRIEERERHLRQSSEMKVFEERYRTAVTEHDWMKARSVIGELEEAFPDHPRPQQMFAEIARLQAIEQKQKAVADGLRAFDAFLQQGDLDQASVALRVIRQMARDDPAVIDAGERLAVLQG